MNKLTFDEGDFETVVYGPGFHQRAAIERREAERAAEVAAGQRPPTPREISKGWAKP